MIRITMKGAIDLREIEICLCLCQCLCLPACLPDCPCLCSCVHCLNMSGTAIQKHRIALNRYTKTQWNRSLVQVTSKVLPHYKNSFKFPTFIGSSTFFCLSHMTTDMHLIKCYQFLWFVFLLSYFFLLDFLFSATNNQLTEIFFARFDLNTCV